MRELKIGVIGSGGRGGLARHAHDTEQGAHVSWRVAICRMRNVGKEPRSVMARRFSPRMPLHEIAGLQELDAVFVTTPDFLHEAMAVAALGSGQSGLSWKSR